VETLKEYWPPRKKAPPNKKPEHLKFSRLRIGVTPYLNDVVTCIAEQQGWTLSRTIRALIWLGLARHKELGGLPEIDR
jgi:hypothetical protein